MTDGIRTRSRVMEEQLTAINERQDAMMTQMESLCSSVHQHAELFETVQKSLAAQQSVMTDLMVKLTRLERPNPTALLLPSSAPPLLPSPPITTTTPQQSNVPASTLAPVASSSPVRPPKLEVPFFSRKGISPWIFQIERFFFLPPSLV